MNGEAQVGAQGAAGIATARGLRVLVLDPIGHLFGNLDHSISEGLTDQGCEVVLATNERSPLRGTAPRYRRLVPYRGAVGDASRLSKLVNYLRSRREVLRVVDEVRPDVVVLYYVIEPRLDGRLLAALRRRGIPALVCAHDILPLRDGHPAPGAWRRLYQSADRIMVFGAEAAEQLVGALGVPEASVVQSFLGVDEAPRTTPEDRALARGRLGLPANARGVLCFGQIKRNKGLDVLLHAFAPIAARDPDAALWVVGRPWHVDIAPFIALAEQLGLRERVLFRFEWVNKEEVSDWFQAADLGVLSYTHLYQSAVAGRACAHGLPLVATRVGNLPDMVRDGESGWLVPPGDAAALSGALQSALADPAEAHRRGAAARRDVQARHSWAAFAKDLAGLLAGLTPRRSGGSGSAVPGAPLHRLRVAFLGTRGIPANYGGYETFAEEVAVRLAARGHDVTAYGRAHYIPRGLRNHRGVHLVTQRSIRSKYLDTVVHGLLSSVHAMFGRYDAVVMCNAVNSPFCLLLRLGGTKVVINVDGLDWTRRKWNALGRGVALLGARLALWCANHIITDARVVQRFYRERFHSDSLFIPYGSRTLDEPPRRTGVLERHGLEAGRYVLFVSRLEPENNAHAVIEAFAGVRTELRLAIVGSAPYNDGYIRSLREAADPRVVFTGAVYGEEYLELQQSSCAYVQATEVGGTHPALLEGMGAGKCVVFNDVPEHVEVIGDAGLPYRGVGQLRERLQQAVDDPRKAATLGARALDIVRQRYRWDDVTDSYEEVLYDLLDGGVRHVRLQEHEAIWRDACPESPGYTAPPLGRKARP